MIDFSKMKPHDLAQLMDFSNLNPDASRQEILRDCEVAKSYNFKGFHVNPVWIDLVADTLEGTGIETGIVISFPFGSNPTEVKIAEAKHAVKLLNGRPGVIDMVCNVGKLRGKEYDYFTNDIAAIVNIAHEAQIECKVILEVCFLSDEEIIKAIELCVKAKADWIKTSTGRHGGPTMKQIALMRKHAPDHIKVKVAGTGSFFTPMVAFGSIIAGAERIGTRNAPWIVDELSEVLQNLYGDEK